MYLIPGWGGGVSSTVRDCWANNIDVELNE